MSSASRRSIIFVSSVQKELQAERRALKEFVHHDPLLSRFFEVFLFEDVPASGQRADQVYLAEAEACEVYVGIYGQEYGFEDAQGISPTEREFDRAAAAGKERLVFVKGTTDATRHPKMQALIQRATDHVVRRRFSTLPELTAGLYGSLVARLERTGDIRSRPFDAAACPRATLADLSSKRVAEFLRLAQSRRGYALGPETPMRDALTHLNLLDGDHPSHAAVLLFADDPQRFLPTSFVKCLRFHGTEIRKPIPAYSSFRGTIFELIDQAVDFVMSKVDRAVGTRARGNQAPETYELPPDAVAEAVVNAIAHRDYASHASVQIMLFADRLEIWNPGELIPPLTTEALGRPHPSIPRNPLLAEPLFLTRYIERAGTGTLDMAEWCRAAGLPPPDFRQEQGQVIQTIWRHWLAPAAVNNLNLNFRQATALAHLHTAGRITNAEFQKLVGGSRRTALRELAALVAAGLLRLTGSGRGAVYVWAEKRARNAPNAPSGNRDRSKENAPTMRQSRRSKPDINPTSRTPHKGLGKGSNASSSSPGKARASRPGSAKKASPARPAGVGKRGTKGA
jgi:ATP-dependent DNA helicase RecG